MSKQPITLKVDDPFGDHLNTYFDYQEAVREAKAVAERAAELEAKILKFQRESKESEYERIEKTDVGRVATLLHKKICHSDHTEGCGWYYRKDWSDPQHAQYLAKAEFLLTYMDIESIEVLTKVFQPSHGIKLKSDEIDVHSFNLPKRET